MNTTLSVALLLLLKACVLVSAQEYVPQNYGDSGPDDEERLFHQLFKSYRKDFRPRGTVQVSFAVHLNQIISMAEKEQIIFLNVFVDHEWIDPRLQWEPTNYGNITIIRVLAENIWRPDTFLYTTADDIGFLPAAKNGLVILDHNGGIFWPNPVSKMRTRCRVDIAWFPFDEQICTIVFGSWSHSVKFINYTIGKASDLSTLTENSEWDAISYEVSRYDNNYDAWIEPFPFSEIQYRLHIRRKPLHVIYNTVLPCLMLTTLTLTSFFIPFPQEMQIGISILLSYSVFTLRLADDVPEQSDSVPLISIYLTICMLFCLTAMIWFSVINKLREIKRMPRCLLLFILRYLTVLVCECNVRRSSLRRQEKTGGDDPADMSQLVTTVHRHHPETSPVTRKYSYKTALDHNEEEEIWVPREDLQIRFAKRQNAARRDRPHKPHVFPVNGVFAATRPQGESMRSSPTHAIVVERSPPRIQMMTGQPLPPPPPPPQPAPQTAASKDLEDFEMALCIVNRFMFLIYLSFILTVNLSIWWLAPHFTDRRPQVS